MANEIGTLQQCFSSFELLLLLVVELNMLVWVLGVSLVEGNGLGVGLSRMNWVELDFELNLLV